VSPLVWFKRVCFSNSSAGSEKNRLSDSQKRGETFYEEY
jgi:hypothetical protein